MQFEFQLIFITIRFYCLEKIYAATGVLTADQVQQKKEKELELEILKNQELKREIEQIKTLPKPTPEPKQRGLEPEDDNELPQKKVIKLCIIY